MASSQASATAIARVVQEQNPWHTGGSVPSVLAPPAERPLARVLEQRLLLDGPLRYQVVLGPRRVGKTTVMYQTVRRLLASGVPPRKVWWLRLDHPVLLRWSLEDLVRAAVEGSRAVEGDPVYVMLDELVYAEQWDLWLKTFYDQRWPVRIAATSSATAALRHRRLESGVGRWTEHYLPPYLLSEYATLMGEALELTIGSTLGQSLRAADPRSDLHLVALRRRELLLTGGFPELLVGATAKDDSSRVLESQRVLRADAVERAIYKDIPQSFGIDNPMMLERLLYILADQTAGILSPRSIVGSLENLSAPTFERYLSYLERAFLVFTLPNYSGAERSVQRRGRKLHFVDPAVRNAALQRGLEPLHDPVELGTLTETQCAAHLHALATTTGVRLYHWRAERHEVDLVLDDPRGPSAFEVASSVRHSHTGLKAFVARYPRFASNTWLVAPNAPLSQAERSADGIGTLPLDLFLAIVSAQAERALVALR